MRPRHILIIAVIIVLILVGYAVVQSRRTNTTDTANTATTTTDQNAPATTNTDNTTNTTATQPAATQKGTPSTGSGSGILKYDDALALYAGRLFQFQNCVAGPPPVISPGSLAIKKGGKYMLDNRDKTAHTLKVSTQSYRLAGQNFVIATAPATVGTYTITCDGGGVAQLRVQP